MEITKRQATVIGVLTIIVMVLLELGVGIMTERANADDYPYMPGRQLPACASDEGESAYACVWLAPKMGNGTGHSFRIYKDGRVKQISNLRAFQLLHGIANHD